MPAQGSSGGRRGALGRRPVTGHRKASICFAPRWQGLQVKSRPSPCRQAHNRFNCVSRQIPRPSQGEVARPIGGRSGKLQEGATHRASQRGGQVTKDRGEGVQAEPLINKVISVQLTVAVSFRREKGGKLFLKNENHRTCALAPALSTERAEALPESRVTKRSPMGAPGTPHHAPQGSGQSRGTVLGVPSPEF